MNKGLTITAVIVLYNKYCGHSSTCFSMSQIKATNVNVIIYDNSTSDYNNKEFCLKHGWAYLGGKGNKGLSVAYNQCIDYVKAKKNTDIIILLDDDTSVDAKYFDVLLKEAQMYQADIYVPIMISNGNIISPFVLTEKHTTKRFKTKEDVAISDKIGAINSCMAIRASVFDNYKYDENIFLDGIDHKFLLDIKTNGKKIRVINYVCKHSLSAMEKVSKESALFRFDIFMKDYRYIFKNKKRYYRYLVGKRMFKLSFQYKTLAFLKMYLSKCKSC